MSNLLTNAGLHTPPGVRSRRRSPATAPGATAFAEFTVADDGPGIAPDLLPRFFDRFVRARPLRINGSGIGLGLAIVTRSSKRTAARSAAESAQGRTAFRVRLAR